ncbi:MAG TPA: precorrin-2 C(20)-methyltransferase [Syntrophomonadaceae bacterium]|nr:precorrin-2 C(20)-methyltransferase [Syntrophomonadaceae bacterium]
MKTGTLYGIGVGPGDPELMTVKAQRILAEVEVLFIPRSQKGKPSLAFSILTGLFKKDWQYVDLLLPMTRNGEILQAAWHQAAEQMLAVLRQGKDAAFITLGDPGMYSSFTYLMEVLKGMEADLPVEIIPGVSSMQAISAWIQQPLAAGQESLAVVPALQNPDELRIFIQHYDNVVLLKAGKQVEKIRQILEQEAGKCQVFLASRCGFKDGFFTQDLSQVQEEQLDYLSTLLIKNNRGDSG